MGKACYTAGEPLRKKVNVMKTILLLLACSITAATAQTNVSRPATNKFKPYVPKVAAPVAGQTNDIRVISVESALATYHLCNTSVGRVYVAGLPPLLKADLDLVKRLELQRAREVESIKAAEKQLRADKAAAPSRAASDTAAGQYIRSLNIRQNELEERANDLSDADDKLKEARKRLQQSATVSAFNTGRMYGSVPIWQIVPTPLQ